MGQGKERHAIGRAEAEEREDKGAVDACRGRYLAHFWGKWLEEAPAERKRNNNSWLFLSSILSSFIAWTATTGVLAHKWPLC